MDELRTSNERLSLEVGGNRRPDFATFKVSGKLAVYDELKRGAPVMVTITGEDGEVIAHAHGFVRGIGFVTHEETKTRPEMLERSHTIKLA